MHIPITFVSNVFQMYISHTHWALVLSSRFLTATHSLPLYSHVGYYSPEFNHLTSISRLTSNLCNISTISLLLSGNSLFLYPLHYYSN